MAPLGMGLRGTALWESGGREFTCSHRRQTVECGAIHGLATVATGKPSLQLALRVKRRRHGRPLTADRGESEGEGTRTPNHRIDSPIL